MIVDEAAVRLEALQAECEKLRKDAERYRWLTEYAYVGTTYPDGDVIYEIHGADKKVPFRDTVDDAIDAAMEQKP